MKVDIDYNKDLDLVLDQLKRGAFLTVSDGKDVNTMTIGWANIGIIWNKPVMMVMVRKSRHTFDIIEKAKDFTVSVPLDVNLKKSLVYCGSYSGRDVDKFKESKISIRKSLEVISPIIKECDRHFECKIIHSQFMDHEKLEQDIKDRFYPLENYHMIYFGEIVQSYYLKR